MKDKLRTREDFDALREEFDRITDKLPDEEALTIRKVVLMANKAGRFSMGMAIIKFMIKLLIVIIVVAVMKSLFHI